MTSETLKSAMSDYIVIRICTLIGILLIASGSARSFVILSFRGEILISIEIVLFLWTINFILLLGGLFEIIAALQVFRGNQSSRKHMITIGVLIGFIVLVASAAQQLIMPLQFYNFVTPDLIGWIGIGIGILVRVNMK